MNASKLSLLVGITLITGTLFASNKACADEFDDAFSDDLFDSIEPVDSPIATASPFSWQHTLGTQVIAHTNSNRTTAIEQRYSGISSVQGYYLPSINYQPKDWLDLSAEFRLQSDAIFWLRANEDWSAQDVDARELNARVNELAVKVQQGSWQVSSGIQTQTVGLADALSIANNLYAQDISLPGAADSEEAILPAWTTWASGAMGSSRIKLGVIHEHKVNKIGVTGTDFATPLSAMQVEAKPLAIENMSAFASVSGVAGALDWQINANTQLEHSPTVEMQVMGSNMVPVGFQFARTQSASAAASYVLGPVLMKAESGVTQNYKAQSFNGAMPGPMVSYDMAKAVLGFDYNHSTMGRVMAEVQLGQVLNNDELNLISIEQNTAQWVLLYSKSWLRETLTMQAQMIGFGTTAEAGRIQGATLEYNFSDQLSGTIRFIDYVSGDFPLLKGADDRDRLMMTVRYQF